MWNKTPISLLFSEEMLKITESQNSLGQKGPERSSHSHPLLYPGTPSTRSGCSKPHPPGLFQGCCVRKCSVWCQVRKDRWGLFAVASQGQHSPEMCHSAAVLEWGKAEEEALYGWQGATGEGRSNSSSGLLKLKRLFGPPVPRFCLDLGLPGKGSCMQHSHKDLLYS